MSAKGKAVVVALAGTVTLLPGSRVLPAQVTVDLAKAPRTWIPVIGQVTHPSMPYCPPPPRLRARWVTTFSSRT